MNIGDKHILKHTVSADETASAMRSGGLPVFATPMMILLMEHTAYALAKDAGYETVGTAVDIQHLKACVPGTELVSSAELVGTEGRKLVFKVCVMAGENVIGEGRHDRFTIDPERFMAKLGKKL